MDKRQDKMIQKYSAVQARFKNAQAEDHLNKSFSPIAQVASLEILNPHSQNITKQESSFAVMYSSNKASNEA